MRINLHQNSTIASKPNELTIHAPFVFLRDIRGLFHKTPEEKEEKILHKGQFWQIRFCLAPSFVDKIISVHSLLCLGLRFALAKS